MPGFDAAEERAADLRRLGQLLLREAALNAQVAEVASKALAKGKAEFALWCAAPGECDRAHCVGSWTGLQRQASSGPGDAVPASAV